MVSRARRRYLMIDSRAKLKEKRSVEASDNIGKKIVAENCLAQRRRGRGVTIVETNLNQLEQLHP